MATPRVTVMVVVRNGMPFLPQSLESIFGQTFRDFELIVVNDGSTDDTRPYLSSLNDSRLRVIDQAPSGIVPARNRCIAEASGGLIAQLDGDDLASPDRLARQVEWFDSHPDAMLLGGGFDLINAEGRWLQECMSVGGAAAIRWALLFLNPFAASAVMYPRRAVLDAGEFRIPYETCEDYDMWCRLAVMGPVDSLPERICLRRTHPASLSLQQNQRQAEVAGRIAGEYAATLGQGFDSHAHELLMRWFVYETEPSLADIATLTAAYARARRWFRGQHPGDPALDAIMAHTDAILRYRCRTAARRSVWHPFSALRWLRTTWSFAPDAA